MKKTAKTKKNVAARKTSSNSPTSKIAAAVGTVAAAGTVLVLRTCADDMSSHGGFRWPEHGSVEAPDWDPTPNCGHGLHGLLWGKGEANLLAHAMPDSKWLVVEVDAALIVDLGGKVKFPRGKVVHAGDRETAIKLITAQAPDVKEHETYVVFGTASATGDSGTASATGYSGTASATGYSGTASATGYSGTASATGYRGTASATGDRGTASATGDRGTAEAGPNGIIVIAWWDEAAQRKRLTVGYVGEAGIEPKVKYCLDEQHRFKKVD